ncbi:hypothetical protein H9L39_08807 [Fusarium oxysporum f. sp. albedinis]|nr:hypothetical protein H9L39_08807 [Fusarium oxysporum f. sp. albedinis]
MLTLLTLNFSACILCSLLIASYFLSFNRVVCLQSLLRLDSACLDIKPLINQPLLSHRCFSASAPDRSPGKKGPRNTST